MARAEMTSYEWQCDNCGWCERTENDDAPIEWNVLELMVNGNAHEGDFCGSECAAEWVRGVLG